MSFTPSSYIDKINRESNNSKKFLSIFLILIPIFAYRWARKALPEDKFAILGMFLGLIISPFSFGLYGIYYLGPFLAIPAMGKLNIFNPLIYVPMILGIMGLVLHLFHSAPGYDISIFLGLIEPRTIVESGGRVMIEIINGIVWAIIYGGAGFAFDLYRKKKLGKT